MEATEEFKVGSSLLVPCVQELAKEKITTLPPRYVRLDQEPPQTSADAIAVAEQVPVIDMQLLLADESMDSELDKFHLACKEWGFFQLVNHGVDYSLLDKVKMGIQDFFNLPMEEKKKFWQTPGDFEGFGQLFVVSKEQKLDWGDTFSMFTLPKHIRKPHLFPKLPLPFRDALEVYSIELRNLAMAILVQYAKALNINVNEMKEEFENGMQSMRMNYYPPCPEPDKAIGLTQHSDAGCLTVLLQVNDVAGLQIRKDGKWVSVMPLANAFIVNIGDMLEIKSNGAYRSIEHRAIVNSAKERLSIATFYNNGYDGEVGPAHSLISEENPALFKRMSTREYFKGFYTSKLNGKSNLNSMRLQQDK